MNELEPASFAKDLGKLDVPADVAEEMVRRMDGSMRDSILKLYRSAVTVGAEWEPALANVSAPSPVLWGTLDPACPIAFADELVQAVRASRVVKLDCSHWALVQKPARPPQPLRRTGTPEQLLSFRRDERAFPDGARAR